MTNFQHFGLYFTPEHVQNAHKNSEREPFPAAWAYLRESDIQPGTLAAVQWNGLRYRFDDDQKAGEQAVIDLQNKAHALIFILAPQNPSYEQIAKQQQVIYQALPADDRRYEGLRATDFQQVLDFIGRSISSVSQIPQ